MSDIELYNKSTDIYEDLQERRPDYVGARKAFISLAEKYLQGKEDLTAADFCCGTGNNTMLISQKLCVKEAMLVDINKHFLQIAKDSKLPIKNIKFIESDILNLKPVLKCDVVISMFAYHHVSNDTKEKYIEICKDTLKTGGILILGEIYSPNPQITVEYYEHLLSSINSSNRTPELEKFLRQTAKSDDFEYKVSKDFAHVQLSNAGFELLEGVKIWPATYFHGDVGTFVEIWQFKDQLE